MSISQSHIALLRSAVAHPPRVIRCEICDGVRMCVRTDHHPLATRCVWCRGTARHRGIYAVLRRLYGRGLQGLRDRSVYELSAHGALFNALCRQAPTVGFGLEFSEYVDDVPSGTLINGVRCENVEALTFADHSFDLITSTDVFEHVENDIQGFRELARVLKPGGRFVFTVPYQDGPTMIRGIRQADGSIRHLLPAEYHGDPFRGSAGVYTWRTYGADITSRMDEAGLLARVEKIAVSGLGHHRSPVIVAQSRE